MTRRIKKIPPETAAAQPLLGGEELSSAVEAAPTTCSTCGKAQFGEVVGGAAAECAAVCCCCPCGLVNLLVLAVYKLPKGICRKALQKKRRRRVLKNGYSYKGCRCDCDEPDLDFEPVSESKSLSRGNSVNLDQEIVALEEEMWAKFYSGGFWRSPSQSQLSENFDLSLELCK